VGVTASRAVLVLAVDAVVALPAVATEVRANAHVLNGATVAALLAGSFVLAEVDFAGWAKPALLAVADAIPAFTIEVAATLPTCPCAAALVAHHFAGPALVGRLAMAYAVLAHAAAMTLVWARLLHTANSCVAGLACADTIVADAIAAAVVEARLGATGLTHERRLALALVVASLTLAEAVVFA
jgi:hypothetical protein